MRSSLRPIVAKLYISAVFCAGVGLLAKALTDVAQGPVDYAAVVFAVLTLVSSSLAIKVPGIPATIAISDAFVFALILLFGGPPAIVTIVLDSLIVSLWRKNVEVRRLFFNSAEPAISTWLAAEVFYRVSGVPPLNAGTAVPVGDLLLPALLMTVTYFLSNTGLTAVAVSSDTGVPPHRVWRSHFLWLSLNNFGGGSIALLLAVNLRGFDYSTLGAVLPLVVILYLTFKTSMARLEDANRHLKELNTLYLSTVETLAMAIDAKDQVTHGHIRRVQTYTVALAKALGVKDELQLKAIEAGALLHDMGKLAVPEHILNKPGKLTPYEYEQMKRHAPVGAAILSAIDFPYPVVPIVRHHHEAWDGSGYPDGLSGTDIPLGARILSVVDCYDAVTSDRPYRPALSGDDAIKVIEERKGTMYDPAVVQAFARIRNEITVPNAEEIPRLVLPPACAPAPHPESRPAESGAATARSRYTEEILRLCELASALAGHASLADAAEALARRLRRLLPATLVVFYVYDPATDELFVGHASGDGDEHVHDLRLGLGHGISGWVAANRSPMRNSDPTLDFGARSQLFSPRLASALSTPLQIDDRLIGVLTLYAPGHQVFLEAHRQLLEVLARQIALTIERAAFFDGDAADGLTDAATGLPTGQRLDSLLAQSSPLARVLFRIPGVLCFSIAQDPYAGSGAHDGLVRLAAAINEEIRLADLVFRHDRDLVVVMANADPAAGTLIVERVLRRFEEQCGADAAATVATGFAFAPRDGDSLAGLVEQARRRKRKRRQTSRRSAQLAEPPLEQPVT